MYTQLIDANAATACDPFDGHVLACVFVAAVNECQNGASFTDALGISGAALRRDIEEYFPGRLEALELFGLDIEPTVSEDEKCLRELLWRFRSVSSPINSLLTFLIARRSTRRITYGRILDWPIAVSYPGSCHRHFTSLAHRNDSGYEVEEILLSNDLPRRWIQHVRCSLLLRMRRLR